MLTQSLFNSLLNIYQYNINWFIDIFQYEINHLFYGNHYEKPLKLSYLTRYAYSPIS